MIGKRTWVFADGDLPPKGDSEPFGHEALSITNCNASDAHMKITVYFPDKEPIRDVPVTVKGERVLCFHLESPWGDEGQAVCAPGQYALKIESDVPVVCVFGRLVRRHDVSYYEMDGYSQ